MGETAGNKFSIRTAMIYITERCPLSCRYCYFKDKKGRDLSRDVAERFLSFLQKEWDAPGSFVISGGEPFLRWLEVRRLVLRIRTMFPGVTLGVQTNGLLLDKEKIAFIRKVGVDLEFGIDGDLKTTTRWRTPMGHRMFDRLIYNIHFAVDSGIPAGCTMTVHPDEVENMADNLMFLKSLGLSSVDITPAAFMVWSDPSIDRFKVEYKKILQRKDLRPFLFTREDHEPLRKGQIDLSLHPAGDVLAGDAFLCLPDKEKKQFSLWDPKSGQLRPELVDYYQKAYAGLWKRSSSYTYRDYVSYSFKIVNHMAGRKYLNADQIVSLSKFLNRAHRGYCHVTASH